MNKTKHTIYKISQIVLFILVTGGFIAGYILNDQGYKELATYMYILSGVSLALAIYIIFKYTNKANQFAAQSRFDKLNQEGKSNLVQVEFELDPNILKEDLLKRKRSYRLTHKTIMFFHLFWNGKNSRILLMVFHEEEHTDILMEADSELKKVSQELTENRKQYPAIVYADLLYLLIVTKEVNEKLVKNIELKIKENIALSQTVKLGIPSLGFAIYNETNKTLLFRPAKKRSREINNALLRYMNKLLLMKPIPKDL